MGHADDFCPSVVLPRDAKLDDFAQVECADLWEQASRETREHTVRRLPPRMRSDPDAVREAELEAWPEASERAYELEANRAMDEQLRREERAQVRLVPSPRPFATPARSARGVGRRPRRRRVVRSARSPGRQADDGEPSLANRSQGRVA